MFVIAAYIIVAVLIIVIWSMRRRGRTPTWSIRKKFADFEALQQRILAGQA